MIPAILIAAVLVGGLFAIQAISQRRLRGAAAT